MSDTLQMRHLPYAIPTLNELKNRGYLMGLVSNRDRPYHESVHNHGLNPYFQFILSAGDVELLETSKRNIRDCLKKSGADQT